MSICCSAQVFIVNNMRMHRDMFEAMYRVSPCLRSSTKREYKKRDMAYWESRKKMPVADVIKEMKAEFAEAEARAAAAEAAEEDELGYDAEDPDDAEYFEQDAECAYDGEGGYD